MAVLICKPIIEIPPRCGGIFLGRGMSKKQERKRIKGKERMVGALLGPLGLLLAMPMLIVLRSVFRYIFRKRVVPSQKAS